MNNSSRVFTLAAQQAQAERGSAKAHARRMAEGFRTVSRQSLQSLLPNRIPPLLEPQAATARLTCNTAVGQGLY
jgi:hypothetical protein